MTGCSPFLGWNYKFKLPQGSSSLNRLGLGCCSNQEALAMAGISVVNFPPPNSRALLPTFRTNCPDGSQFAQMGSHFDRTTTSNPCSLLSRHTPLSGICTYTKHPSPPQNSPFLGLNLQVGKVNYSLGNLDQNWAKCLKSGKTFLEVGKTIRNKHGQEPVSIRRTWLAKNLNSSSLVRTST